MKFIITLQLIFFSSLIYSQESNINCIENQKFKKYYFENISIIERYLTDTNSRKTIEFQTYYDAINQINKYSRINYDRVEFSDTIFFDSIYFQSWKQKWIDWYELNKCRNLQINKKKFYTYTRFKPSIIENNDDCIENIEFGKYFFKYISIAEQYAQGPKLKRNINFKKFLKALNKIDKYSEVSWNNVLNYAGMYSFENFEKDLNSWLEWYELNKCRNIDKKNKMFYRKGLEN